MIHDWSLVYDVEWDLLLRVCFLLTQALSVNDSFSVFNSINLFYTASVIEDLVMSCDIYSFIQ